MEKLWRSLPEVKEAIAGLGNKARAIEDAFFLGRFAARSFYPQDYSVSNKWSEALVLSEYGKMCADECADIVEKFGDATFKRSLFSIFYHYDVLLDWNDHTISTVGALFETELLAGKLSIPHRLGRRLYDRFNDRVGTRTDHLPCEDAASLLAGEEIGVYQLGRFVVGPLGVLVSKDERYVPPSRVLRLWHCSDPGCEAAHDVELLSGECAFNSARKQIKTRFRDRFGEPSEWPHALTWLHYERRCPNGRRFYDLPSFIAETMVRGDLNTLFASILTDDREGTIREALGRPPRQKGAALGPPEQVAKRLSEQSKIQLLLLLQDEQLVKNVDECIFSSKIKIPKTVVFSAKEVPRRHWYADRSTEASCLGIRSQSSIPAASLATRIWETYKQKGIVSELEWKLRGSKANSVRDAVMEFIARHGPNIAVKDLIVGTRPIAEQFSADENLDIGAMSINECTSRLVWKLGFDTPRYEDKYERFRSRLQDFKGVLASTDEVRTEDDREKIRSAGVNFFVSLEGILEEEISYVVWYLASDHLVDTRFVFDMAEAVSRVPTILGESLPSNDATLTWASNGDNALGVLLRYLTEAASWLQGLEEADRSQLRRSADELPHYTEDLSRPFPFLHRQLWADASADRLASLASTFKSIATMIASSDSANIRNSLDHKRDDSRFPTVESCLACVSKVEIAFNRSDEKRLVPKMYWLQESRVDRYGIAAYAFADYRGSVITLGGPRGVHGLAKFAIETPVLVGPGDLLPFPNAEITCRIREPSAFSEYWKGYPRRRRLPPDVNAKEEVPMPESADQALSTGAN